MAWRGSGPVVVFEWGVEGNCTILKNERQHREAQVKRVRSTLEKSTGARSTSDMSRKWQILAQYTQEG